MVKAQTITVLDSIHKWQNDWNSNTLKPDLFHYFYTDAKGNDTQEVIMRFSIDKDSFENDLKYRRTFADGELTSEILLSYDGWGNRWLIDEKSEFTYNSKGLITKMERYARGVNEWIPDSRFIYEYNTNDSLVQLTAENYRSNGWEPYIKQFVIIENGKRIEDRTEAYDIVKKEFDTTLQTVFSYSGQNLVTRIKRRKDFSTGNMINELLDSFNYVDDTLRAKKQKIYDSSADSWIDISLDSFFYKQPNVSIRVNYVGSANNWMPVIRNNYFKDEQGRDTLIITDNLNWATQEFYEGNRRRIEYEEGNLWHEKDAYYDDFAKTWIVNFDHYYYYNEKTTVSAPRLKERVEFTNANGLVNALAKGNIKDVRVYDASGKMQLVPVNTNGNHAQIQLGTATVYFIVLRGDGFVQTIKTHGKF
jgi:hypothetical protein